MHRASTLYSREGEFHGTGPACFSRRDRTGYPAPVPSRPGVTEIWGPHENGDPLVKMGSAAGTGIEIESSSSSYLLRTFSLSC